MPRNPGKFDIIEARLIRKRQRARRSGSRERRPYVSDVEYPGIQATDDDDASALVGIRAGMDSAVSRNNPALADTRVHEDDNHRDDTALGDTQREDVNRNGEHALQVVGRSPVLDTSGVSVEDSEMDMATNMRLMEDQVEDMINNRDEFGTEEPNTQGSGYNRGEDRRRVEETDDNAQANGRVEVCDREDKPISDVDRDLDKEGAEDRDAKESDTKNEEAGAQVNVEVDSRLAATEHRVVHFNTDIANLKDVNGRGDDAQNMIREVDNEVKVDTGEIVERVGENERLAAGVRSVEDQDIGHAEIEHEVHTDSTQKIIRKESDEQTAGTRGIYTPEGIHHAPASQARVDKTVAGHQLDNQEAGDQNLDSEVEAKEVGRQGIDDKQLISLDKIARDAVIAEGITAVADVSKPEVVAEAKATEMEVDPEAIAVEMETEAQEVAAELKVEAEVGVSEEADVEQGAVVPEGKSKEGRLQEVALYEGIDVAAAEAETKVEALSEMNTPEMVFQEGEVDDRIDSVEAAVQGELMTQQVEAKGPPEFVDTDMSEAIDEREVVTEVDIKPDTAGAEFVTREVDAEDKINAEKVATEGEVERCEAEIAVVADVESPETTVEDAFGKDVGTVAVTAEAKLVIQQMESEDVAALGAVDATDVAGEKETVEQDVGTAGAVAEKELVIEQVELGVQGEVDTRGADTLTVVGTRDVADKVEVQAEPDILPQETVAEGRAIDDEAQVGADASVDVEVRTVETGKVKAEVGPEVLDTATDAQDNREKTPEADVMAHEADAGELATADDVESSASAGVEEAMYKNEGNPQASAVGETTLIQIVDGKDGVDAPEADAEEVEIREVYADEVEAKAEARILEVETEAAATVVEEAATKLNVSAPEVESEAQIDTQDVNSETAIEDREEIGISKVEVGVETSTQELALEESEVDAQDTKAGTKVGAPRDVASGMFEAEAGVDTEEVDDEVGKDVESTMPEEPAQYHLVNKEISVAEANAEIKVVGGVVAEELSGVTKTETSEIIVEEGIMAEALRSLDASAAVESVAREVEVVDKGIGALQVPTEAEVVPEEVAAEEVATTSEIDTTQVLDAEVDADGEKATDEDRDLLGTGTEADVVVGKVAVGEVGDVPITPEVIVEEVMDKVIGTVDAATELEVAPQEVDQRQATTDAQGVPEDMKTVEVAAAAETETSKAVTVAEVDASEPVPDEQAMTIDVDVLEASAEAGVVQLESKAEEIPAVPKVGISGVVVEDGAMDQGVDPEQASAEVAVVTQEFYAEGEVNSEDATAEPELEACEVLDTGEIGIEAGVDALKVDAQMTTDIDISEAGEATGEEAVRSTEEVVAVIEIDVPDMFPEEAIDEPIGTADTGIEAEGATQEVGAERKVVPGDETGAAEVDAEEELDIHVADETPTVTPGGTDTSEMATAAGVDTSVVVPEEPMMEQKLDTAVSSITVTHAVQKGKGQQGLEPRHDVTAGEIISRDGLNIHEVDAEPFMVREGDTSEMAAVMEAPGLDLGVPDVWVEVEAAADRAEAEKTPAAAGIVEVAFEGDSIDETVDTTDATIEAEVRAQQVGAGPAKAVGKVATSSAGAFEVDVLEVVCKEEATDEVVSAADVATGAEVATQEADVDVVIAVDTADEKLSCAGVAAKVDAFVDVEGGAVLEVIDGAEAAIEAESATQEVEEGGFSVRKDPGARELDAKGEYDTRHVDDEPASGVGVDTPEVPVAAEEVGREVDSLELGAEAKAHAKIVTEEVVVVPEIDVSAIVGIDETDFSWQAGNTREVDDGKEVDAEQDVVETRGDISGDAGARVGTEEHLTGEVPVAVGVGRSKGYSEEDKTQGAHTAEVTVETEAATGELEAREISDLGEINESNLEGREKASGEAPRAADAAIETEAVIHELDSDLEGEVPDRLDAGEVDAVDVFDKREIDADPVTNVAEFAASKVVVSEETADDEDSLEIAALTGGGLEKVGNAGVASVAEGKAIDFEAEFVTGEVETKLEVKDHEKVDVRDLDVLHELDNDEFGAEGVVAVGKVDSSQVVIAAEAADEEVGIPEVAAEADAATEEVGAQEIDASGFVAEDEAIDEVVTPSSD